MLTRPSQATDSDAAGQALRDWRYAVNAYHLEATDCREMFRLAAEIAGRGGRREDAYRLIQEGRERIRNALRDLETAHRNLTDRLDALSSRDEDALNRLLDGFREDIARWGAVDEASADAADANPVEQPSRAN